MKLPQAPLGLRPGRRPGRPYGDAGLVPLINVIFLILIFIMIAGQMEDATPFRVDPPRSRADTRPVPEGLTLLLAPDGRIAAGDEVMDLDTLGPWLRQWVRSATDASAGTPLPPVAVKADGGAPSQALRSLLRSLRGAGFRKVMLLTQRAR